MQGIALHCRLVRLLNNSLSRVCTTGAPATAVLSAPREGPAGGVLCTAHIIIYLYIIAFNRP